MPEISFLVSQHGGRLLLMENNIYCLNLAKNCLSRSYWTCITYKCKARAVLKNGALHSAKGSHNHTPDSGAIEPRLFIHRLKERAVKEFATPLEKLYKEEVAALTVFLSRHIPKFRSIRRRLRHARHAERPAMTPEAEVSGPVDYGNDGDMIVHLLNDIVEDQAVHVPATNESNCESVLTKSLLNCHCNEEEAKATNHAEPEIMELFIPSEDSSEKTQEGEPTETYTAVKSRHMPVPRKIQSDYGSISSEKDLSEHSLSVCGEEDIIANRTGSKKKELPVSGGLAIENNIQERAETSTMMVGLDIIATTKTELSSESIPLPLSERVFVEYSSSGEETIIETDPMETEIRAPSISKKNLAQKKAELADTSVTEKSFGYGCECSTRRRKIDKISQENMPENIEISFTNSTCCGKLLLVDNNTYYIHTGTDWLGRTYWKCTITRCIVRVIFENGALHHITGSHNHQPKNQAIQSKLFRNRLKELLTKDVETPIFKLYQQEIAALPASVACNLPKYDSIKATLRTTRKLLSRANLKCKPGEERCSHEEESDRPARRVRLENDESMRDSSESGDNLIRDESDSASNTSRRSKKHFDGNSASSNGEDVSQNSVTYLTDDGGSAPLVIQDDTNQKTHEHDEYTEYAQHVAIKLEKLDEYTRAVARRAIDCFLTALEGPDISNLRKCC